MVSSVVVLASRRLLRPRCEAQQPRNFPASATTRLSAVRRAVVPRAAVPRATVPPAKSRSSRVKQQVGEAGLGKPSSPCSHACFTYSACVMAVAAALTTTKAQCHDLESFPEFHGILIIWRPKAPLLSLHQFLLVIILAYGIRGV